MADEIVFRLMAQADLPLLAQWLNRPHLRAYYQRTPITFDETAAKYGPRIRGEAPSIPHLALLDGEPFGYLQCYRVADWRDWDAIVETHEGISVDLFIADPQWIGRGLGRRMLQAYVDEVAMPLFPNEARCWIAHDIANQAARRCSQAVGFREVRTFAEDGATMMLLVRERT